MQVSLGLGRVRDVAGQAEGRRHGSQSLVRIGIVGRVLAQVREDLRLAVADFGNQHRQGGPGSVGTPAEALLDEGMGLLDCQRVGMQVRGRRDRLEKDPGEGGEGEEEDKGSLQLPEPSAVARW
jgi:hypothetical protein